MNDSYVECMVKRNTKPIMKFLSVFLIVLAVVIGGSGLFLFGNFVILIIGIAFGVGGYYLSKYTQVEFEYLYVDKQISVDKIFSQATRKTVAKYDVEKMEILAPVFSYKLDEFKNRNVKVSDYSSGVEKQPDVRYAFYYDGKEKVIFEPNAEFVEAVKMVAPRKVFTN